MANGTKCACQRCSRRGLMGPVVLITIGVLFLLQQMHVASFNHLWPVILVAIGGVKLTQETASMEGAQHSMSNGRARYGSIFKGTLLILVGALLLVHSYHPQLELWRMFSRCGPCLLIFWGASKQYQRTG